LTVSPHFLAKGNPMTKKDIERLEKIIAKLEAWQNNVKLDTQDKYDTAKAKELLMKVSDKAAG
jgi:hypothetical protein